MRNINTNHKNHINPMSSKTLAIVTALENPTPAVRELEAAYAAGMRNGRVTRHDVLRLLEDELGITSWTPVILDTLNRLLLAGRI